MIMVVIPNNKSDAYHAVKKILCVDKPTPSQVMTCTVLRKDKGIKSIATKVSHPFLAAKILSGVKLLVRETLLLLLLL